MKNELDMGTYEKQFTKESAVNTSRNRFIGLCVNHCIIHVKQLFLTSSNLKRGVFE
jgi:hypothetical protein